MGVLVACCFLIGLAPLLVVPVLEQAYRGLGARACRTRARAWPTLAPLDWITVMGLLLIAALLLAGLVLWLRLRRSAVASRAPTWGCGYAAPTPRMQYTSSSFAQMLVGLFGWVLRPRTARAQGPASVPADRPTFHSEVPDTVLDEAVLPAFRFGGLAVLLVPGVPAGEHPDLLAVYLRRPDVLLLWR